VCVKKAVEFIRKLVKDHSTRRIQVMLRKTMLLAVMFVLVMAVSAFGADKLIVQDSSSNTQFVVTDSGDVYPGGKIIVGRGAAPTTLSAASKIEVSRDGFTEFYVTSHSTTGNPSLVLYKSRGTMASPVVVADGDFTGSFFARGYSGTSYLNVSGVRFAVDGTPSSTSIPGRVTFHTTTAGDATFTERMRITSNGHVGISNTSPAHLFMVGNAYNDGGDWVSGSSREFKDNIETLTAEKAISTVKELKPVTYVYKANPKQNHIGFIAEDVPEMVAANDRKGVSAMDIVAVLTKVVQEQDKTIESLSASLARLEAKLNKLESKDISAQK
jgi:hypothetical protein